MLTAPVAVLITTTGRIGPLQAGRSRRAGIVAFAGRPDAQGGGRGYRSLGYGCAKRYAEPLFQVGDGGPYCRTVFFLNAASGRLGDVYTSSRRYVESSGVRIGMPTAEAERRLHRLAIGGCADTIRLRSLTVPIAGGTYRQLRSGELHIVGGRVEAFVLHSASDSVGVFDCW
jgi:hypothetical protein